MFPHVEVAEPAWVSTPDNSPLRRLLRDCFVHDAGKSASEESEDWYIPKAFLLDVARETIRRVRSGRKARVCDLFVDVDTDVPKCRYHQHRDSRPPCLTGSQAEAERYNCQD